MSASTDPATRTAAGPVTPITPDRAPAIELLVDDRPVRVPQGSTLLDACRAAGVDTPTLCFAENLTPLGVCRLCVVEVEGARTLVPSCSRRAEGGMRVRTDSDRVRLARRLVLELLASSVDLSQAPSLQAAMARYGADPSRFGPPAQVASHAGHAPLVDNALYVRDHARCVLCYKCVSACGADAQNTFAIGTAGRGFEAHIATELGVPLPESACVYCGNCIGVCPTGALVARAEWELRRDGRWDESRQTRTDTVCAYCGVGCAVTLHVQDERIIKVTSPVESSVTHGHLCIKGRFGFEFVQLHPRPPRAE